MGMQTNILNDACACTTFKLLSRSPICSSSSSSSPSPSASVEAPAAASASQELFGSRLGSFQVSKKNSKSNGNGNGRKIELETPNLITSTSRGVVPHLTLDHVMTTDAIKWVHVPFETLWVLLFLWFSNILYIYIYVYIDRWMDIYRCRCVCMCPE